MVGFIEEIDVKTTIYRLTLDLTKGELETFMTMLSNVSRDSTEGSLLIDAILHQMLYGLD